MSNNKKEKTVSFRMKKYLFDFLNDFTKDKPYDKTDVMTKLLENFYLESQRGKNPEKMIENESLTILIDSKLRSFLKEFADSQKMNEEEMIVNILLYFFMGFMAGEFRKSFSELKDLNAENKKD
jgi:hypothetical protein